jgi:hypothetical protein
MSWVATAIVGGAVVGGGINYFAQQAASEAQQNANNQALGLAEQQQTQTNLNEKPYQQAGVAALGEINQDQNYFNTPFSFGQYQQSPGYAFQMQQGENAIQQSAAAKGTLLSTGTMQNLNAFGQGLANSDYQNAYNNYTNNQQQIFNRLATVAGLGQQGNQTVANTGASTTQSASNAITGSANAESAATVGGANAITSTIGNGMNSWLLSQAIAAKNGTLSTSGNAAAGGSNPGWDSALGTYNLGENGQPAPMPSTWGPTNTTGYGPSYSTYSSAGENVPEDF